VAFAPADLPRLDTVGVNWRVLGFTCLISAAVAGLLTAVSSWNQLRRDGEQGLAERLRTTRWRGRTRARQLLVAVQVMLTFALLVEAGLLLRTFVSLRQVDLGVRAADVLTTEVALPIGKFPRTRFPAWSRLSWDRYARFYRDLLEYVRGLPGVETTAAVNTVPVTGDEPRLFTRGTDFNKALREERWSVVRHVVTPGYFEALGIPITRGRAFSSLADNIDDVLGGSSRPRAGAAIVNEALARRYWAGDPIGQPIALEGDSAVSFRTVVGITRTVRSTPLNAETPIIYIPYDQFPDYRMTLILRTRHGSVRQVAGILPARLRTFEPDLAVSGVAPYADLVGNSIARQRFTLLLLCAFAGVGLALAMAGVYGLVTYLVSQRTHEIAMRIALGARPGSVVQLLIRDSFRPISLGIGAGVLLSLVFGRLLLSELYGVTPTDPWTYGTVPWLLAILAVLATWLPARRAAARDPAVLLKRE
jgi:predicted permease